MKNFYFLAFLVCPFLLKAQSTYNSAHYAAVGDVFYLTSAMPLTMDYESTGTDFSWDFSTLTGTSQEQLEFRGPSSTGYAWPFIFNPNNTNLSSTNNETLSLSGFGQSVAITHINSYYKKTESQLNLVATAYKLNLNGVQIPITNSFTDVDTMYHFPLNYGNTDNDNAAFTIDIPGVLYQHKTTQRTNEVDGWGSVSTPYGVFPNALRIKTDLIENDTISILGIGVPRLISTTREFKWFDISQKYPVLTVTQSQVEGLWVTTDVSYLDAQTDFQTTALFAYTPLNPDAGAVVYFQNLSTNATAYSWNFDDENSGTANTSTEQHPEHTFATDGIYNVNLTASNDCFSDEGALPIVIGVLSDASLTDMNTGVYPNPFEHQIRLKTDVTPTGFILSNRQGEIIKRGNDLANTDFSDLSVGVYYLQVQHGNQVEVFQVIRK